MVNPIIHLDKIETICLNSILNIYQECMKIEDLGYIKEFWHGDFVFIILFYLFF
jgi:hypothetical protein